MRTIPTVSPFGPTSRTSGTRIRSLMRCSLLMGPPGGGYPLVRPDERWPDRPRHPGRRTTKASAATCKRRPALGGCSGSRHRRETRCTHLARGLSRVSARLVGSRDRTRRPRRSVRVGELLSACQIQSDQPSAGSGCSQPGHTDSRSTRSVGAQPSNTGLPDAHRRRRDTLGP